VRIWRIEPQDKDEKKDGWSSEVVGEFGKGGARVAMVDVSSLIHPGPPPLTSSGMLRAQR